MADTLSALEALMIKNLSALASAGTPLKYRLGDKMVDHLAMVSALKDIQDLRAKEPSLIIDNMEIDIDVNGDDRTEYFDE